VIPSDARLEPGQILLIYDGTCGICSAFARRMQRLDWRRRLAWQPSQAAGLREATGLSQADTAAAAWAVLPSGARRSGAATVLVGLEQLLPGGVPVLSTLYSVPGLHQAADRFYDWFAANRHRIPGVPACGLDRSVPPLPEAVRAELARRRADVA
jgi:predicted DCC family thiol-disulfide oxidoreductase YuxK